MGNFGTGGGGLINREIILEWGGVDTPLQTKVIVQISNQWCSLELDHWFRSLSNLSSGEVHIIIGYFCVRKSGICTRVMEISRAAVS